jgi:thioredoxin-related protein
MQQEMAGRIEFVRLNGDDASTKPLMDRYAVQGYPTLIWLNSEGKVVDDSGYESLDEFRQRAERLLQQNP